MLVRRTYLTGPGRSNHFFFVSHVGASSPHCLARSLLWVFLKTPNDPNNTTPNGSLCTMHFTHLVSFYGIVRPSPSPFDRWETEAQTV